jgi:hypothetical protein
MAPSPAASALPAESAEPIMTAMATPEVVAMPLAVDNPTTEEGNNNLVLIIALVSLMSLVAAGLFLRHSK